MMQTFLRFFRDHLTAVFLFLLFSGIFAVVFSLYELPAEAVLYAAILCVFAGAVFLIAHLSRYFERHRTLVRLRNEIGLPGVRLPEPQGLLERDYQDLLETLWEENASLQTRAARARRDLTDYFTLWAHQVKTPISAMRLLLQSEEGKDAALEAELFKIEQYVEMVLQYLRLESDFTDFVFKEYNLDDMIRQSVRKYSRLFILKKIRLDFTPTGMTVLTDEKWLVYVIEQLISNALKYTTEGCVSIRREGEKLVVADTGIGIQAEDLPRIFDKGFTGYNGREDKKSTGLGLYLSRRILTELGHTIEAASEEGRGASFKIGLGRTDLSPE